MLCIDLCEVSLMTRTPSFSRMGRTNAVTLSSIYFSSKSEKLRRNRQLEGSNSPKKNKKALKTSTEEYCVPVNRQFQAKTPEKGPIDLPFRL